MGIAVRRLFLVFLLLILPSICFASRGISLDIKKPNGATESIHLYKESHALLVGVSDYTNGWPDLNSVPQEMSQLENGLKAKGFKVEKILNPNSRQLVDAYDSFIDRYGFDPENRLLFFFSGHGFSRHNGEKGYVVPADAPVPTTDERGFLRKSLEMEMLLTWAKRIESKHALFLFDSCFSGTVFKSRALPKEPPHISSMVARPVRQFISAGSAGEEVPAKSVFVQSFLRAIEGDGDLDKDGYVTGTELGMYLNRKVTGYRTGQTPQYGKIRNPDLDQGDFVMVAGLSTYSEASVPETTKPGSLTINSNPTGATIYVDGVLNGTAPVSLDTLNVGKLKVAAEMSGYEKKEEYVLVRAGRDVELNFNLDKIATTGSISVSSVPSGAKWYLDGAYVGITPDTMGNLNAGNYKVTVKAQDYAEFSETVRVSFGRTVNVSLHLQQAKNLETSQSQNPLPSGSSYTDPTTGMEFVFVRGGCYRMGQDCGLFNQCGDDEEPAHEVCVDAFYMAKYEVTQYQYEKITGNNPSEFKGRDHPVERVSWLDTQAFVTKLNIASKAKYRLPTEAEWEYAARSGGRNQRYAGTDKKSDLGLYAWYSSNSDDKTHAVGEKRPNGVGVYDMIGNVDEWCMDWYDRDYYESSPRNNPSGPLDGRCRVFRGGNYDQWATNMRNSDRECDKPESTKHTLGGYGFRLVLPIN